MTKIYKSKGFNKLTRKEKIDDETIRTAIEEMESGLIDADLGGHVYKKRIARKGQGKSGGYRTIVIFKKGERAFVAYGFPKNERANITEAEKDGFKTLADVLLKLTDKQIQDLVDSGEYFEAIAEEAKEVENGKKV